jgi:hypothetical protein
MRTSERSSETSAAGRFRFGRRGAKAIERERAGRKEKAAEELDGTDEDRQRKGRNQTEILEDAGHRGQPTAAPDPEQLLCAMSDEDGRQSQAEH